MSGYEIQARAVVAAADWAYSKVNPYWSCTLFGIPYDTLPNPSDNTFDLLRDFVCEYGPNPREFGENAWLTRGLRQSPGIAHIRQKFYEGVEKPGEWRNSNFGIQGFVEATVGIPFDYGISHILGSYNYKIEVDGPWLRFQVRNLMSRESGTRRLLPKLEWWGFVPVPTASLERPSGPSFEELILTGLIGSDPIQEILTARSILQAKERYQTQDPEGGGNLWMYFMWRELYDECRYRNGLVDFPPPNLDSPIQAQ